MSKPLFALADEYLELAKVLSDEQIKAIRDDVLARVKAELKPQDSLSGVEVFCLNHSGAYHNILTIQ